MAVAVPVEGAEFSVKLDSHIRDAEREAAGRKRMGVLGGGGVLRCAAVCVCAITDLHGGGAADKRIISIL